MSRLLLPLLITLPVGCTSLSGTLAASRITVGELLDAAPLSGSEAPPPPVIDASEVLALTPEMRRFVDARVSRDGNDALKVRQLVAAIRDADAVGMTYDEHTRTAGGAFSERRGNCLTFSTLFVAMAREVGLNVQFQQVDVPPDWTVDNETWILNRHVDVRVSLRPVGTQVVDFNTADFRTSYDMRTISDARALAQFYNNVGVEKMQAGDTRAAFAYLRQAIVEDGEAFSPAWTNLGTLYLRHGEPDFAEAAYLQALRTDSSNLVAMSNLASLYESKGDTQRATALRSRVSRHRWRNPYYRYQIARQAFAAGKYDVAIAHLKYAIRQKRNEEWFYSLLGQCFAAKGNLAAARRWDGRARALASSHASRPVGAGQQGAAPPR